MKYEEAMKLKPKQKVIHRWYGVCLVKEVMISEGELFGVIIRPDNQNGRDLLRKHCGCDITDMLENQTKFLSIWKDPAEPGKKPIDIETAWGTSEEEMPEQESKNHFAHDNEGVPE